MEYILKRDSLELGVSLNGGTILFFNKEGRAILRPFKEGSNIFAENCACFPLIPFGNRLENNKINIEERIINFNQNTKDAFYLHGDGWLSLWQLEELSDDYIKMSLTHRGEFNYKAYQSFKLRDNSLTLQLEIINIGDDTMICGLGFHPYFYFGNMPIYLDAAYTHYWTEAKNYLPLERKKREGGTYREIIKQWENICFEGWSGIANIYLENCKINIKTFPPMKYFQTFSMNKENFFCFEPMSHRTNGFIDGENAGFQLLKPLQKTLSKLIFRIS